MRCARSSSSTPTPVWSASARRMPTRHLARLSAAAEAITGLDVFALNAIRAAIAERLRGNDTAAVGTAGMITTASAVDQVFSPFEVACLDVAGHATGRPVSDLLGGLCATPYRSAPTSSTNGRLTPAVNPTRTVRHSTLTPSSPRPAASSTNTASPQSNSREGYSLPKRRWRPSRPCGPPSPTIRCAWIPTPRGRRRRRSRSPRVWPASLNTSRIPRPVSTGWPRSPSRRRCRWRPTCASSHSTSSLPQSPKIRSAWCSPTITTGAACSVHVFSQASATPSASGCRCTRTPTWASAWRRWCTSPAPPRISPTPATPTGRGRPRRSSSPARWRSSTAPSRCPRRRASVSRSTRSRWPPCTSSTSVRHPRPRRHRLHAEHRPELPGCQSALVEGSPLRRARFARYMARSASRRIS